MMRIFSMWAVAFSMSAVALAQLPPAAIDAETLPVMLGLSTPTGKDCSFNAQPGQQGFCLRPPDGMGIWLRADDIWTRVTILTAWKSPPPVRMAANHSGRSGEAAWLMPNEIAGLPTTRFVDRSSLMMTAPGQFESFTLFAVGRQTPGSRNGTLVSSSESEAQSIGWSGGNAITVQSGRGAVQSLPYAKAQEFHVLTVRSERGYAAVFANGQPLNQEPLRLGDRFAMQFVGAPAGALGAGPMAGLRGFSTRAPANPSTGSDIAELIVWPRALNEEEMRTALRYLRRKYQLGFQADDSVMLAANAAPAQAAPAPGAADDTGTKPGSARDPKANYPTTVGQQFARGQTCKTKAVTPDMEGYCLRPTQGSLAWHRADDVFSFERRPASWSSRQFNELLAPNELQRPELVNAQLGRYPIIRFDSDHTMDFRRPMELSKYTIFIVGRRAPGSKVGPIFRLGANGNTYLFWRDQGLVMGTRGVRQYLAVPYEGKEKFHLLTLRGAGRDVEVAVNGDAIARAQLPEGSDPVFRIGHLGGGLQITQTQEQAIRDALSDGFSFAPGRDNISSEIAEILIYDAQLEPEDMEETERYLRKKYSLP